MVQLPGTVIVPESEEDWESELMSPKKENFDADEVKNWELQLMSPKKEEFDAGEIKSTSAENLGSGDEGERNVNAEIEAFGLSEDDFN